MRDAEQLRIETLMRRVSDVWLDRLCGYYRREREALAEEPTRNSFAQRVPRFVITRREH